MITRPPSRGLQLARMLVVAVAGCGAACSNGPGSGGSGARRVGCDWAASAPPAVRSPRVARTPGGSAAPGGSGGASGTGGAGGDAGRRTGGAGIGGTPATGGSNGAGGAAGQGSSGQAGTSGSSGSGASAGAAARGAAGAAGGRGGKAGGSGGAGGAGGGTQGTCTASKPAGTSATGTGPHKVTVETNSAPGINEGTIFRPADLGGAEKYPIFVWGEGGCSQNGLSNAAAMAEIASHGYFVIADGTPNGTGNRSRTGRC